jgi:EpsI family protein
MKSTMIRLTIFSGLMAVIGLVLAAEFVSWVVKRSIALPAVEMPSWEPTDVPRQLDTWHGKDEALDERIFVGTGADKAINRIYEDDRGHQVSLHMAIFSDFDAGVYHSPGNCYRSSGWRLIEEERVPLKTPHRPEILVSVATWEKDGEKALVVFWYELGDYTLFERFDLGKVRWAMRGRATWPPLVKVLLHAATSDPQAARPQVMEFAEQLREWIGHSEETPADGLATR